MKDDIEELVKDMKRTNQEKINEYLKKYEYTAKNLKNIFITKNQRSYRYRENKK